MKTLFAPAALVLTALTFVPAATAQAGPVTLTGQVVCSECWSEQKDRRANPYGTASDLTCAARCSKDDIPQALAVWQGDAATLYMLENGAFTKEGKDFLAYAGKEVEITGTLRKAGEKTCLKVDALKVVSDGNAASAVPEPALGAPAPSLALRDLSGQE